MPAHRALPVVVQTALIGALATTPAPVHVAVQVPYLFRSPLNEVMLVASALVDSEPA